MANNDIYISGSSTNNKITISGSSQKNSIDLSTKETNNNLAAQNNNAKYYSDKALESAEDAKQSAEEAKQSAQQAQDSAISILNDEGFIAVSQNLEPINTVANSIQNVDFVGENIEQINQLVDDLEALGDTTNIAIVATNISDVNKTAENIEAVKNVSNNTDDIDVIVNNLSSINYVAENIEDIQTVEENKELVLNKVADAKEYAESASSNATIATNQATIATSQAGIATSQATIATNQASTATQQANISKDYSNISKQWAISESVVESTDYSSKHYAQVAKNEAVIVIEKASEANQSANTASQMASNASQSASSAKKSEENALEHANSIVGKVEEATQQAEIATAQAIIATNQASNASISASNASNSETEAKKSEENALTYSNNAKEQSDLAVTNAEISITNAEIATTQASNALQSEKNAKTSEANALTYSNSASNSASQSQAYSLEAKAFRDEAEEIVANASNDASWGNIGGNLSDQTDLKTELDNKVSLDSLVEADFVKTENLVEAPFLGENHITNCLTETPQQVKFTLNRDKQLDVKAGTITIIPYGKDDLTAQYPIGTVVWNIFKVIDTYYQDGKFFIKAELQQDTNFDNPTAVDKLHLLGFRQTGRQIWTIIPSTIFSSETQPTLTDYGIWYDTANNYVKYTTDGGSTWEFVSFPIMEVLHLNGVWFKVNTEFNSIGYIGSVIWVDKGVKCLIPNGKNQDGSLNNIEFATEKLYLFSVPKQTNRCVVLGIDKNGVDTLSTYDTNNYDKTTNYNYSAIYDIQNVARIGDVVVDANLKITSFDPKTAFQSLDANIPHITEVYNLNANNGYMVYSNGLCWQWGTGVAPSTANTWGTKITLNKKYSNTAYKIILTNNGNTSTAGAMKWRGETKAVGSFEVASSVQGTAFNWLTMGQLAEGEY